MRDNRPEVQPQISPAYPGRKEPGGAHSKRINPLENVERQASASGGGGMKGEEGPDAGGGRHFFSWGERVWPKTGPFLRDE